MATAPPTDPFTLTGNSREDLARMMSALRGDPSLGFRHDPRPMDATACAPAPEGPVAEAHRRVRTQLEALRTVLGRPALLLLEEAVDDLHYAGADYRARTIMLEETTRGLGNQVDAARSLAARLEEEVARLTDPWLGRYLQALEDAVGEERLGAVQQAASDAWRAAGSPAPAATLLATGQLNRVFGPLDQATEIAVGAVPYDAPQPDDAEVDAAIDRAFDPDRPSD
jgi:hypothetical protein